MKIFLILSVLSIAFLLSGISQISVVPKLGKDPVKKVIAAMTLEEKASLVVGTGMRMPGDLRLQPMQIRQLNRRLIRPPDQL